MKCRYFFASFCRSLRRQALRWACCVALLRAGGSPVAAQTPGDMEVRLPVENDWVFDAGHPIRFVPELIGHRAGGFGVVRMSLTSDFGDPIAAFVAAYAFGRDSLTDDGRFRSRAVFTLPPLRPGFYRAVLSVDADTLRDFCFAYEPERMTCRPDRPRDFGDFWRRTLAELKRVDARFALLLLPERSVGGRRVYEVRMHSLGDEVLCGYWAVPEGVGRYPAVIVYSDYGAAARIPGPDDYPGWGVLVLPPRGQGRYLSENRFGEWVAYGLDSPLDYYYRGAYADAVRGIDFVAAQAGFDGRNLFVTGVAQGGALALAAAALDRRVSAAAPIMPTMADFPVCFRRVLWPASAVEVGARRQRVSLRHALAVLSYFDLQHLTGGIACPVSLGFGMQDDITLPRTQFSAYNPIRSRKRWVCFPESGHRSGEEERERWAAENRRFFNAVLQ